MRPAGVLCLISVLLACTASGVGCSDQSPDAGSGGKDKVPDRNRASASSAWASSADGKLSLRIVTAHGPIDLDEPVPILCELRNNTAETLQVLLPFGDEHAAKATGLRIGGPAGRTRFTGDEADYSLGINSFTHFGAGEVLQGWLYLGQDQFNGVDSAREYSVRYTYRVTPSHRITVVKKARPVQSGGIEESVTIRIPNDVYEFTLEEAAAGVWFDYDVVVMRHLKGVIPVPQDAGMASGPGQSGLMPFEEIVGNGQSYSLQDIGLGKPDLEPRRVKKGTFPLSFGWDGRNWSGPSDTNMPKGDPFPPGKYTLRISLKGEVETPEGRKPYRIIETATVVLTP